MGFLNTPPPHQTIPVNHIYLNAPLIWRLLLSYTLNTPPDWSIPSLHVSLNAPLIWRFLLSYTLNTPDHWGSSYFSNSPRLGDSGLSYTYTYIHIYIFKHTSHLSIPAIIYLKHPLHWANPAIIYLRHARPVVFIIYLKHAPRLGDSGSSKILNRPPSFGDSGSHTFHTPDQLGSSYILNTLPQWAIPVYFIYLSTPLIWRFRLSYILDTPDQWGSSYILDTPPD